MNLRRLALAASLAAAPVLTACDPISGNSGGNPIGIVVLNARTRAAGYTTSPQAAFFRVTGATFVSSAGVQDSCITAPYAVTGGSGTSSAQSIGGGSIVVVQMSGRTDTLSRTAGSADLTYRSTLTNGIPFTPGDSITVVIPGDRNGFPTATFTGKTAEPFTVGVMAAATTGQPINLTWSAATDGNAAMYVQLRYATGSATEFNRQISCSFRDDGTGTIPATLTTDYVASGNKDLQPVLQRVRTVVAQISTPLAYFNLVSEFDRPTPVSP